MADTIGANSVTLHPQITFWLQVGTLIVAILLLVANFVYVAKFRESVDLQRKTSQGTLLLQISDRLFYTEPHKKIIRALEEGKRLRGSAVSDEDLDDHLGLFDTIGTFVKAGILDEDLVYEVFSHYIESAHESPEIAEYMTRIRQHDRMLFSDFDWIYDKMKKRGVGR